jgi:hypothetical protein
MLKGQKAGYYKKQNTKEYHKKRIYYIRSANKIWG